MPKPDHNWHANGPYIVWQDYGLEGWHPQSYNTADDALAAKHPHDVITRLVEFKEVEVERATGLEPATNTLEG